MTDLSHLTFEQRREWEKLDWQMQFQNAGEAAAQHGAKASTCPYEVEAGWNTRRKLWIDGYMGEIERRWAVQGHLSRSDRENYTWCRRQQALFPHTPVSAWLHRTITRAWRRASR